MKVAVMGCIVNGPGEAEGADVAVFAGDRRGIIYVQGEKVANVPEPEILERLLAECLAFQGRVSAGEAKLTTEDTEGRERRSTSCRPTRSARLAWGAAGGSICSSKRPSWSN
jgi:hypothetical protein